MKRLAATSLSIVLAVVYLSGCRAPVSPSGYRTLGVSVSLPADLTSSVPANIRKAIAEDIYSRPGAAASRFIHPNASYAVATIAGPDVDLSTEPVTLSDGSSVELSFPAVPVRSDLTLTVRVFDADGAIVGEVLVEDVALEAGEAVALEVGVLPYEAAVVAVGTDGESAETAVPAGGVGPRVLAAELPGPGLYAVRGYVNGESPAPADASVALYDAGGAFVDEFNADASDVGYGLVTSEGATTVYLLFSLDTAYAAEGATVQATRYSSAVAVYGKASQDDAAVRLLPPSATVEFGTVGSYDGYSASSLMTFTLRNLGDSDLAIGSVEAVQTYGEGFGTFVLPKSLPTVVRPKEEETFQVELDHAAGATDVGGYLTIATGDQILSSFELSLSGYCAC